MSDLAVTSITMTCSACPSQWEGTLSDGRTFYARYRHGRLSFRAAHGDVMDAARGEELFWSGVGGAWDGVMDDGELRDLLAGGGIGWAVRHD